MSRALPHRHGLLRLAPVLTILALTGPLLAGLAATFAPALGWLPALGGTSISLTPFRELLSWPGIGSAVRLSLVTGLTATALAFAITMLICAAWQGTRAFRLLERALSPLLSVPHAAAAFGLAFLIAPSGWIMRALSPWATGLSRPPDLLIVNDPAGLALIAGLVIKEVPFLLLMTLAALPQVDASRSQMVASALGYGRVTGWLKAVLPRVYPQIRLPVFAVLAYSLSVVDVAMILGPSTPPSLAVKVLQWAHDPDLAMRFRASAGAVLQIALVAGSLALWWGFERVTIRLSRAWIFKGARGAGETAVRALSMGLGVAVVITVALGIAGLAVWSVAGLWSFPEVWPDALSLAVWQREAAGLSRAVTTTIGIGFLATFAALALVLACLEAEDRFALRFSRRALWLLYLPLVVPQVGFLLGLQTLAIATGTSGLVSTVIAAHLVFVLPYVFLSLSGPYRAWDRRIGTVAAALGAAPARIFWRLRAPMLLRPILGAFAIGFAVSIGQYLPTILIGAGRVSTLTTEAVALASGGDRRVIGVYALVQALLPFVGFALALGLPALIWRNRRGVEARR